MNAPFQGVTNYANLVNAVNAPTTASQQTQGSILSQLGAVGSLLSPTGTAGGLSSLLFGSPASGTVGTSGYNPGSSGIFSNAGLAGALGNLLGTNTTTPTTNNSGGYTPAQTQAAIDATTAANTAPANPNSTLDPSQLPADSGGE